MSDAIRKSLVRKRIVSAEEWETAANSVDDPTDTEAIVRRLVRTSSTTFGRSATSHFTALTSFQRDRILEGDVDSLKLGHYVVMRELGKGGMGEVLLARHENMPQLVAIKTMLHKRDRSAVERFDREAKLMAQLNHPNITTIYHYGHEGDRAYIAMEFVEGETLKAHTKKYHPVPLDIVLQRIRTVAEALHYAHERGIVHRDVKPENIMLNADGRLKVLDMGIAKLREAQPQGETWQTRAMQAIGTPAIMPPEQWIDATSVSPAADIYSLGCTVFYLLNGRFPYIDEEITDLRESHFRREIPLAGSLRPDATPIDPILQKMLAKRVDDRFRDCLEVAAAIDRLRAFPQTVTVTHDPKASQDAERLAGAPPLPAEPPALPAGPTKKKSSQLKTIAISGGIAACAIVGLLIWAVSGTSKDHTGQAANATVTPEIADSGAPSRTTSNGSTESASNPGSVAAARQRFRDWLAAHRAANSVAWEGKLPPSEWENSIHDDGSMAEMKSQAEAKTREWASQIARQWLNEFQVQNADLWPDVESLVTALPAASLDKTGSSELFQALVDQVHHLSTERFRTASIASDDADVKMSIADLVPTLRWLVDATSAPADPNWKLEVETLVNDLPSSEVRIGDRFTVRVRTSKSGFPILLVRDSTGGLVLFRWTKPLLVGEWQNLLSAETDSGSVGTDQFVVIVAETSSADQIGFDATRQRPETVPGNAPGYLMPPASLSQSDQKRIRGDGKHFVTGMVRRVLENRPAPFLANPKTPRHARQALQIKNVANKGD